MEEKGDDRPKLKSGEQKANLILLWVESNCFYIWKNSCYMSKDTESILRTVLTEVEPGVYVIGIGVC